MTFKTVSPDCLKSLGESRKVCTPPYTGATTNYQSSLGVLLLLRQSPPVLIVPLTHAQPQFCTP